MKKLATVISQADLARKLKVAPQHVTKLLDAGVIEARPDRRINLATELPKATAYLKAQAEATALHSGKTALAAKKLSLQCELLQAELDQVRGKVHSKENCCQSLSAILAATSRELHGLARLVQSQFPELPSPASKAIDAAVDTTLARLKSGLSFRGTYHCPKCAAVIDEIRLEPLPEDKQP